MRENSNCHHPEANIIIYCALGPIKIISVSHVTTDRDSNQMQVFPKDFLNKKLRLVIGGSTTKERCQRCFNILKYFSKMTKLGRPEVVHA